MKQILFILGSLGKGGAERVALKLCNNFIEMGYNVIVVLLLNNTIEYELPPNLKIVYLCRQKRTLMSAVYWIKNIRKIIKKEKPTAIISFAGRINVLTLIAARKNTVVVSERNDPRFDNRSKLVVKICEFLYEKKAKHIIFQTNEVKMLFNKKVQAKSSVIANPISEPICFKDDYRDFKSIIMVGRIERQKNYWLAIDAFELASNHINADLYIYGDGTLKQEIKQYANSKDCSSRIHLMGQSDNPFEIMAHSSLFLLSSFYEGLSNSLMEAMSIGLPCLSTPVAGSNEIIKNGETGILLDSFNANEMSSAIIKLSNDVELRKAIGNSARKEMRAFYESVIFEKWNHIILEKSK